MRFRLPMFSPPKTINISTFFPRIFFTPVTENEESTPFKCQHPHICWNLMHSQHAYLHSFLDFKSVFFLLDNFNIKSDIISLTLKKSRLLTSNLISFALFCFVSPLLLLTLLLEQGVQISNLHFITCYSIRLSTQSLLALANVRIMKDH